MSIHSIRFIPLYILVTLFLLMSFFSCSQLPPPKTVERDPVPPVVPGPVMEKDVSPADGEQVPLYDILAAEAQKFAAQGNYHEALFVYNQAYVEADDAQKNELIPLIETLLAQTPSQDIGIFSYFKQIHIPRELIQYWLGWNLTLENKYAEAKIVLESYIDRFPEHQYYSQAVELLEMINDTLFGRDTIGCLLPLTGKYAFFGRRALDGIQLAVQEMSRKYARQFKIVIEDTRADPDETVRAVHRLYEKNAAAIIGPLLNVEQAGQAAESLGIPLIALTQKQDFPNQGDYLFANFITPQMQVQTLGSYLFGDRGIQKVAILYPNEKYGKTYMNLFWDVVDAQGGEVVGVESYDGTGTDFTAALRKLTGEFYPIPEFLKPEPDSLGHEDGDENPLDGTGGANPRRDKEKENEVEIEFQALFIPDSPSRIKLILPQLAFNDIKGIYLLGTNLWHHPSLLKRDIRGYNRNAIIANGFFDQSENPETIRFTKSFEELFGKKPQFLEAIAHDTASILFSTAMDTKITSRKSLKDALQGSRIYEGATGVTVFDENGNAHRRLFLVTIKNQEFVEINH